ncbi:MAG: PQQ-binding-like beta-propeller repeat protein, partial [Methylobacillus sp.]|nr:PQQ-binding-like beta-propeller repeat protein [Methylobacillus sp.]
HIDAPREDAPLGAVIGVAGLYGRPGFLAAFDAESGKRIWQFDTVPPQGWEGQFAAATPDGVPLNRDIAREKSALAQYADAWRYGGGSAWTTPAIDPKLGLLYFGTGNPSPQMDDVSRPGDNLYTVSLVALDVATGKLRWHYQLVPHDIWGYDVASPPVLFNFKRDGKTIPAVGHASKMGWFYVLDRATGKLLLKSEAFVPQSNMFARATPQGTRIYPGVFGGVNWSPGAVDEAHHLAFVAAMHMPARYTLHETPASGDKPAIRYTVSEPIDEPKWGLLSAIDLSSGKIKWQQKTPEPLVGGVLATAGGVLFTGEGNGNFNAYDSATGKLLWQTKAEAGVNAPPITYEINGEQYIAVVAGGNAIWGYKQGDYVLTFKLDKAKK